MCIRVAGLCVLILDHNLKEREREMNFQKMSTLEPLKKGHFGANSFVPCREVVPISEVNNTLKY